MVAVEARQPGEGGSGRREIEEGKGSEGGRCVVGAMSFLMLGPMSWLFMLLFLYAPVRHSLLGHMHWQRSSG